MTGRPRRLTDPEIDLWLEVARTIVPRPDAALPQKTARPEPPRPKAAPLPEPGRRPTAASYTPPSSLPAKAPLAALDRKYKRKVAGGRVAIDETLDLHGMTQSQAHGALVGFLIRAQARDARLVLVVTGKGKIERTRPDGEIEAGVLRRAVPFWLRDSLVRNLVVGFEEAARPHGGAGALYIRLRRRDGGR